MFPSIHLPHRYLPGTIRTAADNLLCHGEVQSLPFGKRVIPFKIYLSSKDSSGGVPEFGILTGDMFALDSRLRGDVEHSPYPLSRASVWSKVEISQLADTPLNQAILNRYRIFWMSEGDPNE